MPRFCANLSMLYPEHAFLDRFAAAATDGFLGVECQFPYEHPAAALAERLERHGLVMVLHNLPAGDGERGERGLACLPGREGEFQDGVGRAIEYAKALGCRQLNCLAGVAPEGVPRSLIERALIDNLRFAAAALGREGIRLLIEPINTRDVPGFVLHRADQAEALLAAVGSDDLFIQYDVYHMQRMQGDLVPTFRRLKDRIAHVQIADHPGRHEPGTGEINYPFVFAALDREGYAGWVGCEYHPKAKTSEGLVWLRDWQARALPSSKQ